jgi:hypothetical protein
MIKSFLHSSTPSILIKELQFSHYDKYSIFFGGFIYTYLIRYFYLIKEDNLLIKEIQSMIKHKKEEY